MKACNTVTLPLRASIGVGVSLSWFSRKSLLVVLGNAVGLWALFVVSFPALADEFDTVNYNATVGITYDNNIFRLPTSVAAAAMGRPSKSDRIRLVTFGVSLDKKYSNQELLFKANVTNNKYNTFSFLDYNSTAYKASWNWSLGSKLNGVMGVDRTQTLNSFADTRTNTRNLRTMNVRNLNADWWFESSWHLLLGASSSELNNSTATVNNLNSLTQTGEVGLKYVSAEGSSVTLLSRNIRGSYINAVPDYVALIDTGYTEKQKSLQMSWPLTGKSVLSGNLTSTKRSYPIFFQRNYSGMQGAVNYAWSTTDKTQVNASMTRSTTSWFGATSSYVVTDTLLVAPTWQLSAKTDMRMSLKYGRSNYLSPIVTNAPARRDVDRAVEIGGGWSPQRAVRLSASVQHSQRASSDATVEYRDNTINLTVTGTF